MDFKSVVTGELAHTHTDPLLALIFGLGFPQQTPENPQKISKLYQIQSFPEPSSAAIGLQISTRRLYLFCMQTYRGLSQRCRESGAELQHIYARSCRVLARISDRDSLYYVTVD